MGVIVKEHIDNDCLLGMWEIVEDFDTLMSLVTLDEKELEKLNGFKSPDRKLEWLSVRALLNNMMEKDSSIVYNESRKPFLADNSHHISISHSNKYTSVMLSKHFKIGIDLEYMSHRISNIAHKFINEKELITSNCEFTKRHLYVHWCAKEALYKICDKENINFKENLTIQPFELANEGWIVGTHHDIGIFEEFRLKYQFRENYIIVYCLK